MQLSTPQLAHLVSLMRGESSIRPDADFTANDAILLRQKLEGELANRRGSSIPPDWRQQAQAYVDAGRPITEFAPSKQLRDIESRASKIEAARLAALPANDLLGELGL